MVFEILKEDTRTHARLGRLHTAHGVVQTPVFMDVGTLGTVKALEPRDLVENRAQVILGNTYHLMLRPGKDVIACVGNKFVIWRFSEKCQEARNQTGRAKRKEVPKSKADPVGKGVRARRAAARKVREQRNQYFREQAIEKAIERSREKQLRDSIDN